MIKIEYTDVYGWEAAIRGARNPMNSWDKSDTVYYRGQDYSCAVKIGPNDFKLLRNLANAGPDHGKYLRMITVTVDLTAPLYWWKEFDTYKVGTVANSCSTMHKLTHKEFELDDFSHEHLDSFSMIQLERLVCYLNKCRANYLGDYGVIHGQKTMWWQMIQLLPSSYNQRRTVLLNYAVLRSMYHARRNHKLDCWRDFCKWVETLPYAKELICDVG